MMNGGKKTGKCESGHRGRGGNALLRRCFALLLIGGMLFQTMVLLTGCGGSRADREMQLLVDLASPSITVEFTGYESGFESLSQLEKQGLTAVAVVETLVTEGWERTGLPPAELQIPGFKAWFVYRLRYPVRSGTEVKLSRRGAPLQQIKQGTAGVAFPAGTGEAWVFRRADYFLTEGVYAAEARRYSHPAEGAAVIAVYEPDPAAVRKTELLLSGETPGEFCRRYVTLGDETRYALYVPGRSRLDFPGIELPDEGELRFGAALLSSPSGRRGKGVRFEVRFSERGERREQVLFSKILPERGSLEEEDDAPALRNDSASKTAAESGWGDFSVPFGKFGGRRGTLSLVTGIEVFDGGSKPSGPPDGAGTRAAWSRPLVTGTSRLSGALKPLRPGGSHPEESNRREAAPLRRVILILIDTLRRDHLGCYGYDRPVSPTIDSLAAAGTIFDNAVSQAPWTRPSVASMFASRYPRNLGILAEDFRQVLPERHTVLAEMFRKEGYTTAAIVANVHLKPYFGLHRGFDSHVFKMKRADELTDVAIDWIAGRRDLPFFLYLHYADPHSPYVSHERFDFLPGYDGAVFEDPQTIFRREGVHSGDPSSLKGNAETEYSPPAETRRLSGPELDKMVALYDGEIRFVDYHLGRLFGRLRELDLDDGALIVITSDHGEEFRDHGGYFHGYTLYGEQLRVPLIFSRPSAGLRRGLARLVDIAPTLCEVCGIPTSSRWTGASLAGRFFPEPGSADDTATGASKREDTPGGFASKTSEKKYAVGETMFRGEHRISLRHGAGKVIYDARLDEWTYFDLKTDPEERRNLSDDATLFSTHKKNLELWMEENPFGGGPGEDQASPAPDAATIEQLQSLGYLH